MRELDPVFFDWLPFSDTLIEPYDWLIQKQNSQSDGWNLQSGPSTTECQNLNLIRLNFAHPTIEYNGGYDDE